MAGIAGQGTTFNLPNYVGPLFNVSPEETPLLSAIGGLTGGAETKSVEIEWQVEDLRDPEPNRSRLEGAVAPQGENRVRRNVTNVVEIHQEVVEVSYTKQAATGQFSGANISGTNPVEAELPHQVTNALLAKATDIEASFIRGKYAKPATNTETRKTRGILEAIETNKIQLGTAESAAVAGATITLAGHGLSNGDTLMVGDDLRFVISAATDTFSVAATKGGSAITFTGSTLAVTVLDTAAPTKDTYDELFQAVFDNGGMKRGATQTILVGSHQKRNLSRAYAKEYGKYVESSRNVGGVNFTTIVTDFGTFNVMIDRWMPADAFGVLSLEQLRPRFLVVPGKGHFFEEELGKVGASDRVQIYGEVGLEYGNERSHGVIRGLPTKTPTP